MMHEDKTRYYWDMRYCDKVKVPFNFIIGGRGTGKTYRSLSRVRNMYYEGIPELDIPEGMRFMYLRRTETEITSIADQYYNPFKVLNTDNDWAVKSSYTKKLNIGAFREGGDPEKPSDGELIGYAAALSVFSNLRGADLSDCAVLVFDEFIKEGIKKVMKNEADAFFNAYETINRNRENSGKPPLYCYLLSNATDIESPLLVSLGLIPLIEHMRKTGQGNYTDPERGIHIEYLHNLGITEAKKRNALYKLTQGTQYYKHAIENEFSYNSFENVVKQNLKEYIPWIQVGDVYIYRSKHSLMFYASDKQGKCQYRYTGDSIPLFRRQWGIQLFAYIHGNRMMFSSYEIKMKLLENFPEAGRKAVSQK